MKPVLKINFSDFWSDFKKDNNFFTNLLSTRYTVEISESPDIHIYSCFGTEYLKYNCVRIFYVGENIRPDFAGCDYAMTADLINDRRHYRLPLYKLYFTEQNSLEMLAKIKSLEEIKTEWAKKTRFCCMVVSNPKGKRRNDFFHKLSNYKKVDSGGKHLNNIGGAVKDKFEFIKNYKFVFAFENSSYPGYVTEKIIQPLFLGSIPIYWGNPNIELDFNKNRFINYHDFKDEEALIKRIREIDENDDLAIQMLSEPVFANNKIPDFLKDENILAFFSQIIQEKNTIVPVAMSKKIKHGIVRRTNKFRNVLMRLLGLNFR